MTTFCLKMIATIAMTLHHITMCIGQLGLMNLFPSLSLQTSYYIVNVMNILSRVAFPLFAFLLAEGASKTSSMPKYIKRLTVTALISEPIYYFAFSPLDRTVSGFLKNLSKMNFENVFFTLAIGALLIYYYQTKKPYQSKKSFLLFSVVTLLLSFIASYVHTSYGGAGVLLIVALYLAERKSSKAIIISVWSLFLYIISPAISGHGFRWEQLSISSVIYCIFSVLSAVLIYLYNGKRGKPIKWSFYVYYPVHILLLILARSFIFSSI